MLEQDDMYAIPQNEIGQVTSNLIIYSIPFALVAFCFCSYSFEILGRKWTLTLSYVTTAIMFWLMPKTSPSYGKLIAVRCLIGFTMAAPLAHPLIADYVEKDSRGKGTSLSSLGTIFGEVFGICILMGFSHFNLDYYQSFDIFAVIILAFSACFYFAIKEPSNLHDEIDQSALSFDTLSLIEKVGKFNEICKEELTSKPILRLCIVGASITRLITVLYSIYLILWIKSFDQYSDSDSSKTIYLNIMIAAVIMATIMLPFIG